MSWFYLPTFTNLVLATQAVAHSPDTVTLEQALARARSVRPQVMMASAVVDRARGVRRTGMLIPNPTTQFEQHDLVPLHRFTVTQPLAWIPRHWADRNTGRAAVERAAADSAQLLADLARDVRTTFFAVLAAEQREQLLAEQALLADSLAILAERRVVAGDISVLERDQVRQEAARAQLGLARAREDTRVAQVDFGRAIGWQHGMSPRPAGLLTEGLEQVVKMHRIPARDGTPTGAADSPMLRAAIADSTAAAARLQSAQLARLPIPAIIVGHQWGGSTLARNNTVLGLALPVPLWNQGNGAVAEARGAAVEGAARLAETRLTVMAQIAAARIRVSETAARASYLTDSLLPEARRIRAGAVRLYDAGRTGILPVFDALRTERDVAQTVTQELLAFQQAQADLIARLGGW